VAERAAGRTDRGLKPVVGITEEMSKMTLKLMAATFGMLLAAGTAYAGPLPGGADTDGDTVENAFDNCTNTANAPQTDTDHDGCGDSCSQNIDCDINGDTSVGAGDFATLRMQFNNMVPPGTLGDCASPLDGVVGANDFALLRMTFNNSRPAGAGPSGITTAQCNTALCTCTPAP
jgi:hypothetical protein